MDAFASEWLNLIIRWFHITAGIAWIGSSFYFVWLDLSLDKPKMAKEGVGGELWSVHGGGFYFIQKFLVAPKELPEKLHWFKWEAYSTWISGFLLLSLIYYVGAQSSLIDPSVAKLSTWSAIGIGLAVPGLCWYLYHFLCKSPLGKNNIVMVLIGSVLFLLVSYFLSQVFSAKGAYIHMGAVIGTIMAANVFFVIIPNQKIIVNDLIAGRTPPAAKGLEAKQRSVHNNYFTLPVLFIMISGHFPSTFNHKFSWAVLAALAVISAGVRHFFNLKHRGEKKYWIWLLAAGSMLGLALGVKSTLVSQSNSESSVSSVEAIAIVNQRCVSCHSKAPTDDVFTIAPNGFTLDSIDQIQRQKDKIMERAIQSKNMPLANKTGMTEEERSKLGAWLKMGAPLNK